MLTEIDTPRLRLRPLVPADAPALQRAAAARAIADTMISVPHPCPPGEAARFIAHCQAERKAGRGLALAIKAVAHKLARACYHMLREGTDFDVNRAFA